MNMENKIINGIHATRYIMSWVRSCGELKLNRKNRKFEDWLRQLVINGRNLTEEEIQDIKDIAQSGKMELEMNAKGFWNGDIITDKPVEYRL